MFHLGVIRKWARGGWFVHLIVLVAEGSVERGMVLTTEVAMEICVCLSSSSSSK